ncbi:MAG: IS3-like element ISAar4 family transposase, partial [Gammaproteobacteria bacterium]
MSEKYELIEAEYDPDTTGAPTIVQMCSWLGVSRSGFYEWRSCPESAMAQRRAELKILITKAFEDSEGTYGSRRVAAQ